MTNPDRRAFLGQTLRVGAVALATPDPWAMLARHAAAGDDSTRRPDAPIPDGRLVETFRFEGRRRRRSVNRPYGRGLSGRLRHDLSKLTSDTLVTPNDTFYIRTRCPDRLDYDRPWTIRLHGLVESPVEVPAAELARQAAPMGVHLLECSGTGTSGLISAAEWDGVPVTDLLDRITPGTRTSRILISGFDEHSNYDRDYDERGCDWIFTRRQLAETGAFIATKMNGQPLPRDHGYPVRLVVPGWYGCCCVKWLDEIRFVPDDVPATRHMRHFARRTHQPGRPRTAREFRPAKIDLAAMPVRVEKWQLADGLAYRVVGIMWGGDQTTSKLEIRFGDAAPVPVDTYNHRTNDTWTLWSHVWRPRRTGVYRISLRVDDPNVRTRRLDSGYYNRTMDIREV